MRKWRKRFIEERLPGLYDEPRVGAKRWITDDQVEAIVVKTLENEAEGSDPLEHPVCCLC